jgi:hypothetical protein
VGFLVFWFSGFLVSSLVTGVQQTRSPAVHMQTLGLLSGEESISRKQSVVSLYRVLCGTTQHQFRDFQIHFVKQCFGSPGKLVDLADLAKLPSLLEKTAPVSCRDERRTGISEEGNRKNHAC